MLAYAEADIPALAVFGREVALALKLGFGGGGKVCRAGHKVGNYFGNFVYNLSAGNSCRFGLVEAEAVEQV